MSAIDERAAVLLRLRRVFAIASVEQLQKIEDVAREMVKDPQQPKACTNSTGCKEPLPKCSRCGGWKPGFEPAGEEPQPYMGRVKGTGENQALRPHGGTCLPCKWQQDFV